MAVPLGPGYSGMRQAHSDRQTFPRPMHGTLEHWSSRCRESHFELVHGHMAIGWITLFQGLFGAPARRKVDRRTCLQQAIGSFSSGERCCIEGIFPVVLDPREIVHHLDINTTPKPPSQADLRRESCVPSHTLPGLRRSGFRCCRRCTKHCSVQLSICPSRKHGWTLYAQALLESCI